MQQWVSPCRNQHNLEAGIAWISIFVSQWIIIPVLISILKIPHYPSHGCNERLCLLSPSSPLQTPCPLFLKYAWNGYTSLPFFKKKNNPQNEPAIDKKKRNCRQLGKAQHECWLIAASFQMARMKVMLRAGRRRVISWGHLRKNATIPRGVVQKREAAEGVGDGREVTGILIHKTTSQDGSGGRTCTINVYGGGEPPQPPSVGRKASHKEFRKGGLKSPQRYWLGMVTLCKICRY